MDVAVRELKARLSSYLKRAAAGEYITVTDRGRPIAVLGPPAGVVDLASGIEQGWIAPATKTGLPTVRRARAAGSVLQALGEDRTE